MPKVGSVCPLRAEGATDHFMNDNDDVAVDVITGSAIMEFLESKHD